MWFPARIKEVDSVDINPALDFLATLSAEDWAGGEALKQKLAGSRPTQSIFLYSLTREELFDTLSKRPLRQEDVPRLAGFNNYYPSLAYLFDKVREHYSKDGVFVRAQLAKMGPGAKIDPHRDSFFILENSHRIHIPLVTTEKLQFVVDDELVRMDAGKMYELNNQVMHWVNNPKDSIDRIHLIIDYLPPEYNVPQSLAADFKFYIKKHRAGRPVRLPIKDVSYPELLVSVSCGAINRLYLFDLDKESLRPAQLQPGKNSTEVLDVGKILSLKCVDKEFAALQKDQLVVFDKDLKIKGVYKNSHLKGACSMFVDGRFSYVACSGCDGVLRFNFRKKVFDKGWRLTVNEENGAVCITEFCPSDTDTKNLCNQYGVNAGWMDRDKLVVGCAKFDKLIHYQDGKARAVEQLHLGAENAQPYNKGILYSSADHQHVVYSANYDYRQVDLESVPGLMIAAERVGLSLAGKQGSCLLRHLKGTTLFAVGSKILVLDMKNQAVVRVFDVPLERSSSISSMMVWSAR